MKRHVHNLTVRSNLNKVYVAKGPGGRSSDSGQTATVFGCTGFLGRYLVNNLAKQGTTVVVPYRGSDDDRRHLKVMGDLGQIVPLRFDLRDETQIAECVRNSDIVYNLVGRDYATKNFTFDQVHVDGARRIAKACRENGVDRLIHVSALNASPTSKSHYLSSKGKSELAVREEFADATIVRPGSMFGHEDRLLNRIGWFMKWTSPSYVPFPLEAAHSIFRPVYVGDVAQALSKMLQDDTAFGKTVELAGPRAYYAKDFIHYVQEASYRKDRIVYIPKVLAKPGAALWDAVLALPVVSADSVERVLAINGSHDSLKFKDLGHTPANLEDLIVRFMSVYKPSSLARAPFQSPPDRFLSVE